MYRQLFVLAVVLSLPTLAPAAVKPHPLFADGAVLQQGCAVPVWGTANDGEKVTVKFAGQTVLTTAKDGQWLVKLKPLKASTTPQTMTLAGENTVTLTNLVVGEVWVCSGQSNMQWAMHQTANATNDIAKAGDPQLRLFSVPRVTADKPQRNVDAVWQVCSPETVSGFSAVAYFFGRDLRKARSVPVGLIHTSWGGTPAEAWTAKAAIEANPTLRPMLDEWAKKIATYDPVKAGERNKAASEKHKAAVAKAKAEGKPAPSAPRPESDPAKSQNRPANLYNAMIAPLQPYAIAGAIWYQGESNNTRPAEYQTLFPTMIKCWRNAWGQGEFPFLFVQIAPHEKMTPELREAQLIAWQKTPKTAMAVITDWGEATDIHPKHKEPVGGRLALAARAIEYREKIEYSGPVYESVAFKGDKAILKFTHVDGGLVAKGGDLKGFTIAGADQMFLAAEAKIDGKTVVVTSKEVAKPVAVRYGWSNVPDVNLFNKADLPATPFRTDLPK